MRRTGAQIVWDMLRREGVGVVFGMPGGSIMPIYDLLEKSGVRHVLVRHEQAAAHAADGFARVSGKVGVALATSGPGATNLTTGIATAMLDSIPLVCITGQVPTSLIGSDAFQEADITGITLPITKHNYLVTDVADLASVMHEAFLIAQSGRPGPVLIDLPKDVQAAETEFAFPNRPFASVQRAVPEPEDETLRDVVKRLTRAERPVFLAGHGVVRAGASASLVALAERSSVPVATTLLGKGAFPDRHPLALGMMGMHGSPVANRAIQAADLLVALGMRFDDRVTGRLDHYAPGAVKVHVDLDAAEIGKNVPVDLSVVGEVGAVLRRLLDSAEPVERAAWSKRLAAWRTDAALRDVLGRPEPTSLAAPRVIDAIWQETEGKAVVVTDVGQNQMWAAQYYPSDAEHPFVTSGGLGTMGFGLPAGIGAQIAAPDEEVWVIAGDGGFQMNVQELATVVQEDLPLRIAVINNGSLGMVRQWQEMFFGGRYAATRLVNPDFVQLAAAYGIAAWRARTPEAALAAISSARAQRGPALVEFQTTRQGDEANVYPIVPSEAALDEMIRRPEPGRDLQRASCRNARGRAR
ncbi:MAG: biosynthetic-type acetolactate synthase large subunit [Candidatus Bipolaricaulis sp.]|nr:biosynthetic-type acetolactate synthase large subunit [Candidatus Bipolaricaulis sp.]